MRLMLAICFFLFDVAYADLPWKDRHAEVWAWYHDFKISEPVKEKPQDPIEVLTEIKKDLERTLAKALLDPSKENIQEYIILQKRWVDQSKTFSENWQLVILEHPELASLVPTTQYGIQVKKSVDQEQRKILIKELSSQNTLVFFYEGGNAFSQAFAFVVKQFSYEYGWEVKPISVDGLILRDFPQSISDRGVADEMDIHFFPALFAVDVKTRQAKPLAFGMVTVSQIEDHIAMQFSGGDHD